MYLLTSCLCRCIWVSSSYIFSSLVEIFYYFYLSCRRTLSVIYLVSTCFYISWVWTRDCVSLANYWLFCRILDYSSPIL